MIYIFFSNNIFVRIKCQVRYGQLFIDLQNKYEKFIILHKCLVISNNFY